MAEIINYYFLKEKIAAKQLLGKMWSNNQKAFVSQITSYFLFQ